MQKAPPKSGITRLLFQMVRACPPVWVLLPLTQCICIANVVISTKLEKISASLFGDYIRQPDRAAMIPLLRMLVLCIAVHYFFSAVIDCAKGIITVLLFGRALADCVGETAAMRNDDFHRRGQSKCQDDIQKSSWALYEITSLMFVDQPRRVFHLLYTSYEFSKFMTSRILLYFMSALGLCLAMAFAVTVVINRSERRFIALYRSSLAVLTDILCNVDVVQAFSCEQREKRRYEVALSPFMGSVARFMLLRECLTFLQKFSLMVPHFVLVYFFLRGSETGLTPENLLLYNQLFIRYKSNLLVLRDNCFLLSKRFAEASCRLEIVPQPVGGDAVLAEPRASIVAEDLTLCVGGERVNEHLAFEIAPGEKVAITGHNGSGKSTFLKTMLRFQEHEGGLRLGGVPIEELRVATVRRLLGYVPQDHHIMNGTVLFNLAYGQEKPDEEEIYRLCRAYGCHEFFERLPQGYQTPAGENGVFLSGGQRQRVNFMRAIIRGTPIILLDEPTANLDKQTEAQFITNVLAHVQDRTVVMILHNLELLRHFDKILFFRKGGVSTYDSYEAFRTEHAAAGEVERSAVVEAGETGAGAAE